MTEVDDSVVMTFKISGKSVANIARDLMLEKGYLYGRYFLEEGIDGITIDVVEQILKGQKTFSDDGRGFTLVDQDPDDPAYITFKQRSAAMLSCAVFWKDKFWTPYAVVDGAFGKQDLPNSGARNKYLPNYSPIGPTRAVTGLYRALYYADDPHNDVVVIHNSTPYLFRNMDADNSRIAPWVYSSWRAFTHAARSKVTADVSHAGQMVDGFSLPAFIVAINEYTRDKHLEPRGYMYSLPDAVAPTVVDDVVEPTVGMDAPIAKARELVRNMILGGTASLADAEVAACDEILEAVATDDDRRKGVRAHMQGVIPIVKAGLVTDSRYGIIDPAGEYYPCLYMQHDALLHELYTQRGINATTSERDYAYHNGWIKVHGSVEADNVLFYGRFNGKTRKTAQEYWMHWHPGKHSEYLREEY